MGADIDLIVEYDETAAFRQPYGIARLDWPRQTELFVAMSGVWNQPCLIPAKGFPEPASWLAYSAFALQVVTKNDWDATLAYPSIIEDEALEAIESGKSRFLPHLKNFISNPNCAWPSWLTLDEFQRCIEYSTLAQLSLQCELTLLMMEAVETRGLHARMVFWFDL